MRPIAKVATGQYVLELNADDTAENTSDFVTINVLAEPPPGTNIAFVAGNATPPSGTGSK